MAKKPKEAQYDSKEAEDSTQSVQEAPEAIPKFTKQQVLWLKQAWPANFRIRSVAELIDKDDLMLQYVFHQGIQLVVDTVEDLYNGQPKK